jgi:hypothetical protein
MTELPARADLTLPPPIWLPPMNPAGARFLLAPARQPQAIHRAWEHTEVAFCGLSVLGVPEWVITREIWEANEVPFCDACSGAAWAVQFDRETLDPPPQIIIRRTVEQPVVLCPHCLRADTIASDDRGLAFPKLEFFYAESIDPPAPGSEEILATPTKYDHDFDTLRYTCANCTRSVSVPDDTVEFVYG